MTLYRLIRAPRLLLLLVALSVSYVSAAEMPSGLPSAPAAVKAGGPAAPGSAPQRDWEALRQEIDDQLQQTQQQLQQAAKGTAVDWWTSTLELRAGQLKYLTLVYAQQQVVEEERRELQQDLEENTQGGAAIGLPEPDESRPFSFLYYEQLQDRLDDERTMVDVLEAELKTARELVETTEEDRDRSDRERRQIKEELDQLAEPGQAEQLRQQLLNAELGCRLFGELIRLRKAEIAVKKLDLSLRQRQEQILQQTVDVVKQDVQFSQSDLEKKLSFLDEFESELRDALTQSQDRLQQIEQLRKTTRETAPNDTPSWQGDAVEAGQETRESLHEKISQIQQTLADLVVVRYCWNLRFKMHNQQASAEQLTEWLHDIRNMCRNFRDAQRGVEIRLAEAQLGLATTEKQLRQLSSPDDPRRRWLQLERDVTSDVLSTFMQRLQALQLAVRFLDRFDTELTQQLQPLSASARIATAWSWIEACWEYELLAVDDKPITTGKIIKGILLLLAGSVAARIISRVVGRRILPRMGVAEGASLALQTIGFYGLVILFSLFTLELINIPITVFTFFGGAAAIAVGFGSQNILNNFMSGLILLSEQPIRIGDLVELGGLTGTIERIGARSTKLRTGANVEYIIPNSKFLDNSVTNWTLSSTEVRVCVQVGVAYGSPTDQVIELLGEAVKELPQALMHREPIILFTDFGDNALHFAAHFWIHLRTEMDGHRAESALRQRVDALFRKADITVAFPQRDVHLDLSQPIELKLPSQAETSADHLPQRRAA